MWLFRPLSLNERRQAREEGVEDEADRGVWLFDPLNLEFE